MNLHDKILIAAMGNPEFIKSVINRYGTGNNSASMEQIGCAIRDLRISLEKFVPGKR